MKEIQNLYYLRPLALNEKIPLHQLLVSFASLLIALISVTVPIIIHLIGKYTISYKRIDERHKKSIELMRLEWDQVYARRGLDKEKMRETLQALEDADKKFQRQRKLLTPERQFPAIYIPLTLALISVLTLFFIRENFELPNYNSGLFILALVSFSVGIVQICRVFFAIMRVKEEDETLQHSTKVSAEENKEK